MPEIGMWIDDEEMHEREKIASAVENCHRLGGGIIFPRVRYHGNRVMYKSRIEASFYEEDVLGIYCVEARKRGMDVHPWFCLWGDTRHPLWHARGKKTPTRLNWPWMCPAREESHDYFLKMLDELANNYDTKTIQLDFVRYADEPCYCDFHRQDFQKKFGEDPVTLTTDSELWPAWCRYNTDTITNFVKEASRVIRGAGKRVSADVWGIHTGYKKYPDMGPVMKGIEPDVEWVCSACRFKGSENCRGCEKDFAIFQWWPEWCEKGYLDEVLVMMYTGDIDLFGNFLTFAKGAVKGTPFFPGLSIREGVLPESESRQTAESLLKEIRICLESKTEGIAIWEHPQIQEFMLKYPDFRENLRELLSTA